MFKDCKSMTIEQCQQIYAALIIQFKTATKLAELLKINKRTVYRFAHKPISLKYILSIESLTNCNINRQHLRPDLYTK